MEDLIKAIFIGNGSQKIVNFPDEKWASDLGQLDMIVLSVGHWFLHSAVYYYGDSVLGCHYCSGQNYTEIGFYDVYGKAYRTTLNTIIERRGNNNKGNRGVLDVIVTTFSPAHFEGEWDKLGACPKTKPYNPEEKKLEWMDAQMRETAINQVNAAKKEAENLSNVRIEAVDVTKLALLRPDGHPGPYMHPFPFANGVEERVQNDCVHWCLPGPIDTWNEILLQVIKKWTG
ncbi:PREDICTED: protein ALTERED XYLOGLUCAN 4 isoform X2 [Nicotiana attenuata]|uniref:protein ALTERED XYLOGLUCAN 4 isoform X2 n=1 Tax=Nicotiana attenuata TaxID=49451 RepID=UPI000904E6DA|nr:PREDICTED: protein ALTERED XYLOGLUCAN 4 isoform X2 [Nicotiana attenuata]